MKKCFLIGPSTVTIYIQRVKYYFTKLIVDIFLADDEDDAEEVESGIFLLLEITFHILSFSVVLMQLNIYAKYTNFIQLTKITLAHFLEILLISGELRAFME